MMLDAKAAEMRREYLKEWRRKNPQKVKEYNEGYWRRKAEQGEEAKENHAENANSEN